MVASPGHGLSFQPLFTCVKPGFAPGGGGHCSHFPSSNLTLWFLSRIEHLHQDFLFKTKFQVL